MIADDGETISDLGTLRDQDELFGRVASTPTAWRTLEAVDAVIQAGIAPPEPGPGPRYGLRAPIPVSTSSTSTAPSSAPTPRRQGRPPPTSGASASTPWPGFLDATGEALAAILRPGNTGSNTTADHVRSRTRALSNLPSTEFTMNEAWAVVAPMAHHLLAWTRLVAVEGDLARAQLKRLRYCPLHTSGVIARSGRRVRLRLASGWPWSEDLLPRSAASTLSGPELLSSGSGQPQIPARPTTRQPLRLLQRIIRRPRSSAV